MLDFKLILIFYRTPVQPLTNKISQTTLIDLLVAFKSQSADELDVVSDQLLENFKDEDDFLRFTKCFLEAASTVFDFYGYARLAQLIEDKLKARKSPFSFFQNLSSIIWKLWMDFPPMESIKENKTLQDLTVLVKIAGELSRVKCISSHQIFQMLQVLATSENSLECLRILIQIVSTTWINRADVNMPRKLLEILQARNLTTISARKNLIYQDLIETFENIVSLQLCKSLVKIDKEQIVSMLGDLNSENIIQTAEVIKSLQTVCSEDLSFIVDALISNALKSTANKNFASLALVLQNVSLRKDNSENISLKSSLADKCNYTLFNNLSGEIKLHQLQQTLNMFDFFGELFLIDLMDSDYIFMCLKLLLIEAENDNAAECMSLLITKTGKKLDMEESKEMEDIFKKFHDISREEKSYRTAIFQKLISLRNNHWIHAVSYNQSSRNSVFR